MRRSAFDQRATFGATSDAEPTRSQSRTTVNRELGHSDSVRVPAPSYAPQKRQSHQSTNATRSDRANSDLPGEGVRSETKARTRSTFTKKRLLVIAAVLPLVLLLTIGLWAGYLFSLGNSNLTKIDALTDSADTPGTTYLIVGSDERDANQDSTEGTRADTIMLLHVPTSGNTALVSIPRDTLVTFPDGSAGKINASLNLGGQKLLVETVEGLTGLGVDHYIQIGMSGVEQLTDAVGGVNLCLSYDVDDELSGLVWEAGCHEVDGEQALAFSRMRYADPLGDIGRTARQRQVVSAIIDRAVSKSTLTSPSKQKELVEAASSVLTVDESDNLMTIARAGFAMRDVMGADGLMGTPPIADLNYYYNGGSHVLLDPNTIDQFWADLRDGKITAESFANFQ